MFLLNDAYYFGLGKFKKCEIYLNDIINKVKENKNCNVNLLKENLKLCEQLSKIFNVEKVNIEWFIDSGFDVFTHPIIDCWLPLTKTNYEIKIKDENIQFCNPKNKILLITISTSLISTYNFSADEILAFILHEIGHNFYNTNYLKILSPIFLLLEHISYIKDKVFFKIFISFLNNNYLGRSLKTSFIDDMNDSKNPLYDFYITFKSKIQKFISLFNEIIFMFVRPIKFLISKNKSISFSSVILNPLIVNSINDSYNGEKFSDNFVTMHGYGLSLSKAFLKFEKSSCTIFGSTQNGSFYFFAIIEKLLFSFLSLTDAHPMSPTRINEQKKFLEEALNDSKVNPKFKTEIKKQINEIEITYNNLFKQITTNRYDISSVFFIKFFTKIFNIDTIKDKLWSKTTNYDWDNAIKNNIKK